MPKKSVTARGGAQRTKAKTQKSFELVRPVIEVQEEEPEEQDGAVRATTSVAKASTIATVPAAKTSLPEGAVDPIIESVTSTAVVNTASKGTGNGSTGGSSRTAARRQAAQQRTPRVAMPLVTSEHYAYVRKDLMFIAILAIIMFATIIVLHFTLG